MLVAALSTGHKLGLALVGAAFVAFALVSAFVLPALRPDYPARRGLPAFLTLSVALFVGMMFAVFFFGRESEEGRAEGGTSEPRPASTGSPTEATPETTIEAETTTKAESAPKAETTTRSATAPTTTRAETSPAPGATTPASAPKSIPVTETEFKIELPQATLAAGSYRFELSNKGKLQHDLVVDGPGVSDEKTPVINGGKTASLSVKLQSGTYELYCSVPGHKQAGMDLKITVG